MNCSSLTQKRNGESGKICENCGVPCAQLHTKDNMCNTCFLYWKNTGEYRPLTGPLRRGDRQVLGILRQRRGPPRGMYINHDDLSVLASATPQAENVTLFGLEREVLDMKCRVQTMKQNVEMIKRKLPESGIDKYRPKESTSTTSPRVNARWTQEELMLAAQGIRRYGKDFAKIAELLQTKSETHLKSFYANYRKRFGLDGLVEEHQTETCDDFPLNLPELPEEDTTSVCTSETGITV